MKTFPAAFATELAKKSITPVWVLRMTVNSVVYHISDIAYTFPVGALSGFAGTTLPWVSSWGQLHENISGSLGEILIADLSLSLLVDQANADNIRHLALTHDLETSPAELYLWLDGLNAASVAPQMVFRGYVKDVSLPDLTRVDITIEDEAARLRNYIGTRLDASDYPLADPDDIGKMIPIPFGTVEKVRAVCVDSGWVSSLINGITTTQTVFDVSELPTYSLVGKTITIDDEEMTVTLSAGTNWAASSNGGSITATTTDASAFAAASYAINGIRTSHNGYDRWISQIPPPSYPQTLTVTFAASKAIEVINLFFTAVNGVVADPTLETINVDQSQPSFNIYTTSNGGGSWDLVEAVTGNNKAWYQSVFASRTITGLKVDFTARTSSANWVNCSEIEAYAYAQPSGKTLTVIRSSNGIVSEHSKGSVVIEKKTTPLVYLCSDQALTSIGSIYSRIRGILVDITSDCTKYLGTVGNQLAAYPGKAAVEIPQIAKVQQRIALALAGDVTANDYSHTHNAGASISTVSFGPQTASNTSAVSTELSFSWLAIQNQNRFPADQSGIARTVNFAAPGGTALTASVTASVNVALPSTGGAWCLVMNGVRVTPYFNFGGTGISPTITLDATAMQGNSLSLVLFAFPTGAPGTSLTALCSGTITSASRSGTYTNTQTVAIAPAPSGVTVTNTLELTGNSVSDIMIGEAILVDMVRTMATPAAVFNDILTNYCGDSTPITQVGTFPAEFAFNGVITDYRPALEWFDRLAFQCFSYFRKSGGIVRLIYRDPTTAAAGTISACKLNDEGMMAISHRKVPVSDIVNRIKLYYARQWDSSASGAEAFALSTSAESSGSIAIHGVREQPDLFYFDFVTDSTMASTLLNSHLSDLLTRKWLITFTAFLDSLKYEFGDYVTLDIDSGQKARVIESGIAPGDTGRIDTIEFTVTA